MDILKILNGNFKSGGYLVSVFEYEKIMHQSKEQAFLTARRFIEENHGTDVKYIWFQEKDAPDSYCGCIFVSEAPDVAQMLKRGIRAGWIKISPKNFPALANYINDKADGKFGMNEGITRI